VPAHRGGWKYGEKEHYVQKPMTSAGDFEVLLGQGTTPGKGIFPAKLPSWTAMAIGLFLVVIFALAAVAAIIVSVPETIRCPFVLVPQGGADPVHAPREGMLTQILTAETVDVRRGQELFVLRSQEIHNWTTELRTLDQDLEAIGKRAALLKANHETAVGIQTTRIQQYEKDLDYQQEYLGVLRDFLKRMEKLEAEGVLPTVEVLSQRLAASKGERDVAMTRQSRDMATLELASIQNEHRKQEGELELEKRKILVRMSALRQLLQGTQADLIPVCAPFDGTVVSVAKKNLGDVVTYGQELCRIARSDSTLIGKLSPPEDGVPRLAPGQKVQLFFRAFPYERFGSAMGTLQWVSPAAITSADGEHFMVHAVLDKPSITVRGEQKPLRAGMGGEARILVGKRTLIEYVFEPIRKLRENWKPGT
jgi:membrane fusion protein